MIMEHYYHYQNSTQGFRNPPLVRNITQTTCMFSYCFTASACSFLSTCPNVTRKCAPCNPFPSTFSKLKRLKRPRVMRITSDKVHWRNRACYATIASPLIASISSSSITQAVALNSFLFIAARVMRQRMLTNAGVLHAFLLGVILWSSLSWRGYILCASFLVFGSLVTRIGRDKKEALGISEKRHGARGPENIWGAAGVAAICAILISIARVALRTNLTLLSFTSCTLLLGYTASLATKFADTTSSEIGKAYGVNTYLITSLKRVPAGTEGAVSVEGTLAGMLAACLTAAYGVVLGLISSRGDALICVFAAVVATTAESYIGAALQQQWGMSNELVNFINTLIGAVVAMSLHIVLNIS